MLYTLVCKQIVFVTLTIGGRAYSKLRYLSRFASCFTTLVFTNCRNCSTLLDKARIESEKAGLYLSQSRKPKCCHTLGVFTKAIVTANGGTVEEVETQLVFRPGLQHYYTLVLYTTQQKYNLVFSTSTEFVFIAGFHVLYTIVFTTYDHLERPVYLAHRTKLVT